MEGKEREAIAKISRGIRGTFLEGELILGGSSGLFGFPTEAPAFTEDLDFLIREDLVIGRGAEIVDSLSRLGYARTPDTPTFTSPGRPGFDLVGYSARDLTDHLSPPGALQVMVFGDLGVIMDMTESVDRDPGRMPALSPAGFCAVKLLTLRVEKGSKDKLQALLVIAERAKEPAFRDALRRILGRFDPDRRTDALADAQAAFLAIRGDPGFRDRGAEGYVAFLGKLEEGYAALSGLLSEPEHG